MRTRTAGLLFLFCSLARAETGEAAWLRYAPVRDSTIQKQYADLPATVVTLSNSPILASAREEMLRGISSMLGKIERVQGTVPNEPCTLIATVADVRRALPALNIRENMPPDSYLLQTTNHNGQRILLITGPNDRGVLYGAFSLLQKIALHQPINSLDEEQSPYAPIRWTNEWDNLDGTVERGYGGRSIFFDNGNVLADLNRAREYARLLASIGINGCTINNVNTNPRILDTDFLHDVSRIAAVFRPFGVRISLSVDFSSPKSVGHLNTFDPLDPKVAQWWKSKADEVYAAIPDLAGFLMKADSEGRVGPSTYGRTHADAANVIAAALAPHGGILVYRAFVYNHHLDWRDPKNDRARAAYDNFAKLDGQFRDNVVIQVKNGPIDFQVREPVSPLIAALHRTNQALELQITQEYTGQQRQLCFLLPMWKETTDFDLHAAPHATPVKAIVAGKTFARPTGGFVGVADVGLDPNWLGSDLAMANLYAFGRLAWNPDASSTQVIDEWTRLTFGHDPDVVLTITALQLRSWPVYEEYTGPLGAGGLTDITGSHYGPGIESSERNGWGQWHRADAHGIGMDRTASTGTGYIAQYPPAVAHLYESIKTCPDSLLLFMHHVPYTHVLHSGKTVIQHIYDSHYSGAAEAATFPERWSKLSGKIDETRFEAGLELLRYQAGYAVVWRDAVCNWFRRESHIADKRGRVGNHPDRVEAESMSLAGYASETVKPWEDASGGKAVSCSAAQCTAATTFRGNAGWYEINTQYFDFKTGVSRFVMRLNGRQVDAWSANSPIPNGRSYADASTRHTTGKLALRDGDQVQITGIPSGRERAMLDYIEFEPAGP
jgi:alpha-glucuronidase